MSVDVARSFGVVAIGRNEGERLKRCLGSASNAAQVIYVNSGSTDGSLQWARQLRGRCRRARCQPSLYGGACTECRLPAASSDRAGLEIRPIC